MQFLFGFHALGDDPAATLFRHQCQRAYKVAAVAVARCRLAEQLDIQLENVGFQCQHPVEHRIARAKIIDGNAYAGGTVALHYITQLLDAALQFGDFKNDLVCWQPQLLKQLQAGQWLARLQLADPGR